MEWIEQNVPVALTVELRPDSSQDVQIVMDSVPMGLSGFKITLSVSDPTIAQISAVSFPNWATLNSSSALPSSSVWIKAADLSNQVLPGKTNVLLGTITIVGKKIGTADLSILPAKISDDNGTSINTAMITGKVIVSDKNLPILPVANFSSNVNSGYTPLSVKFTDLSKNATKWRWNFGDGSSSKQQSPTHIYYTAGTYTVNLIVSNKNGTDSKQAKINVSIRPPAYFTASRTFGYHRYFSLYG